MTSTQSFNATGISVKSAYGEDLRKFQLTEVSTKKLRDELGGLYHLNPFSFHLKYTDEEGDLITLSSESELQSLVQQVDRVLKITVVPKLGLVDKQSIKRELKLEKLKEKLANKTEKVQEKLERKHEKRAMKMTGLNRLHNPRERHVAPNVGTQLSTAPSPSPLPVPSLTPANSSAAVNTAAANNAGGKQRKQNSSIARGRFIKDVTYPDGSYLSPGETFTKTWRFRNEGTSSWPFGTRLLFISKRGDNLGSPESVPITSVVDSGKEVDVSVTLKAPEQTGRYVSYYRLCGPDDKKFGQRVRVLIQVGGDSSSSAEERDEPVVNSDETTFASQLDCLAKMGFNDNKRNIRLLKRFKGDLNAVVTKLVNLQTKKNKIVHNI